MLTDWITVRRVIVSMAERLYPEGLDWHLKPGVNAIVGGTSLGKTTLVSALQYGIFATMIIDRGERIERDFFKDRLSNRSRAKAKDNQATVEVQFSAGGSSFLVKRNLLTGTLIDATCDGATLKEAKYRDTLAEKVGLKGDFPSLVRLQSQLLFFGESRFLLAWENLIQNELLNLMLSDQALYSRLNRLWEEAQSADSEARNLSAQASRMQKQLNLLSASSNLRELRRRSRLNELAANRESSEARLASLRDELRREHRQLGTQDEEIAHAYAAFHLELDKFETEIGADLDDHLLHAVQAATPTIASVRHSLEGFFQAPDDRPCPCCGRSGLSPSIAALATAAAAAARTGRCVVCCKEIAPSSAAAVRTKSAQSNSADVTAARLQTILFKREQTRSRLDSLKREETEVLAALAEAREAEFTYLQGNPAPAIEPLGITITELRRRQRNAERRRGKKLTELRSELATTTATFRSVQSSIAKAFKKYATLYLDEPCDVRLLEEDELPGRRGPQIKAPHAAFFPVVSGQPRAVARSLSGAQRSFIDLALRMAIVDVWHQQTAKTVTMIIETPEGAVDLAYMERVATMLRTFANQGHTLIVTTNLNNEVFLPELLASHPKRERMGRILNLIEEGRPRDVQRAHHAQFAQIIHRVESRKVAR